MNISHVVGAGVDTNQIFAEFVSQNYDRLWLKSMIQKAQTTDIPDSVLITGSSHALNGIYEPMWKNAVNCSMHSQDLYYDFVCARNVLEKNKNFTKCFIILGYYITYQDLSLSKIWGKNLIERVYYPIFHDAHHLKDFTEVDPWDKFDALSETIKLHCEEKAESLMQNLGYYNEIMGRTPFYDLQGYTWAQLSDANQDCLAKNRAEDHNKIFQHKASFEENKEIFRDFVHYLYQHEVMPILVVPPFTQAYNRYVLPEMKAGLLEMLDAVPEDVHYIDFNDEPGIFDNADFVDTDHLNADGAKKMSMILADMFG